jgi:invasion protein IalB
LQYGTRVIVDQQPPITRPFFTCFTNGCMADFEATPDLIGKFKHGQMLTIQAINLAGSAIRAFSARLESGDSLGLVDARVYRH